MTKGRGFSRACSENNVLSANLGICVLQNIRKPLSLHVCKLTLLELESVVYDSFESLP